MSSLVMGSLPPIIGYEELSELIREAEGRFKGSFPHHVSLKDYDRLLTAIKVRRLEGDGAFALQVPIVNTHNYTLYELKNFPLTDRRQTYLITNLPSFLAIATDKQTFTEDIDISQCSELQGNYVCPPALVQTTANPTCAMESWQMTNLTHCETKLVNLTRVLTRHVNDVVYLYVQQKTWATLDCQTPEPEHLEVEGAYVLHPPCTLISPDFKITSVRHATVTLASKKLETIPVPDLTHQVPTARLIPHVHQLQTELKDLRNYLNDTQESLDILTTVANIRHHYTVGTRTAIALITLCIIMTYVAYRLRCKRSNFYTSSLSNLRPTNAPLTSLCITGAVADNGRLPLAAPSAAEERPPATEDRALAVEESPTTNGGATKKAIQIQSEPFSRANMRKR